ncbi:energy transducer TonB [Hymenobacter chitinivorans]|uniref:TonB family protein n=1 Tax=Hymenobacter chitinivorans DSM 11115 TaxID=1121954 RepID=A0A2M9B4G9_9BACT|nr:energy transducer TonB [Hymenobacter chitinivorans]PJJ52823.1 TonB family protein [Hymenobacter chitinivorans DSM 11115]
MRPANQPPVPPQPPAPNAAGHLPLPLLRQYVAGALPAAEQHRVEAHTLGCPRCAEVLEGLEMSSPAVTDQALSELRSRLHQRVTQPEHAPRSAARAWQAVAAVLALLLVSTALWWGLRRPAAPAPEPGSVAVQLPTPPSPSAVSPDPAAAAPEPAVAAAESAAVPETPAAPAAAAPASASRRAAAPARYTRRRPVVAATRPPAAAPAAVPGDKVASGSVAMQAPVAAAPSRSESADLKTMQSRVLLASKAADTVAGPPAVAKAPVPTAEESAKRQAALPPAPVISPQPVEGYLKLREYLRREAMFRPEYPAPPLSGSVRVRFTVKADGTLDNFKILRGLRRDYDQEAIRLLCEGPAWQPGAANGRRADQVVDINVTF